MQLTKPQFQLDMMKTEFHNLSNNKGLKYLLIGGAILAAISLLTGCRYRENNDFNYNRVQEIRSFWPDCKIISTNLDGYIVKNNNKIYHVTFNGSALGAAKELDKAE